MTDNEKAEARAARLAKITEQLAAMRKVSAGSHWFADACERAGIEWDERSLMADDGEAATATRPGVVARTDDPAER